MRRKMILALMLAIVSSAWMTNEASIWCMPSVRTTAEPWIEVSGTFKTRGFPYEPGEPTPNCLTIVLVTSDKTYYLVTDDGQLIDQLDTIPLGTKATVSGIPFTRGSYDYIQVSHIETDQKLPSLCDEWNVLGIAIPDGHYHFNTYTQRLTTDTIIGNIHYDAKLEQSGTYLGAMRESYNRDIYYIPNGTTHEYLLCAFNAQAGDTLYNMWVGGHFSEEHNGKRAVIREIRDTNPKTFVVVYEYTYNDGKNTAWWPYYWIEGVGMSCGPSGEWCPFLCAGDYREVVLCAYKNGEQVYVSEEGKTYGCEYNGEETSGYTIPLYARDDSGSSTVDPVDPNQVIAKLREDKLIIREYMGQEITYLLQPNTPIKTPLRNRAQQQSDTFRDEVTIPITESGEYILQLTNPSWDYTIIGQFYYAPQGIKTIQSVSTPQKMLLNGHLYILRGDHIYDTQGKIIK